MNLKPIGDFVLKYAPLLGGVISATNPLAGLVVTTIADMFGADSKNPEDILAKMSSDPDAETKLKQIEAEQQNVLVQARASEFSASVDDRSNARGREEAVIKETGKRDWVIDMIAVIVIIGFFGLCILNYFIDLKDDHVLIMLIGQISSGFMIVLGYYFGASSQNS